MSKESLLPDESIEYTICIPIRDSIKRKMTHEESTTMILLYTTPIEKFNIPEEDKPDLFKMVQKRIEVCFEYKISDERLLLFICMLSGSIGIALLYLWYFQYWTNRNRIETITFDHFTKLIFPNGYPETRLLQQILDSQKTEVGNMVDMFDAGKSLYSTEYFYKTFNDGK